ncbi:MAG: alpha/beta hydrolase [Clostridiales bacterium]|nr:alpha/beta hydrolase [Clostridiales bacterium]
MGKKMSKKRVFKIILLIIILSPLIFKMFSFTPKIDGGISEMRSIEIGGVRQTILLRGEDINNPILLYLHSGPGTTELIPFRKAHQTLESHFTVVQWEQRGTGKSYSSAIDQSTMTISQLLSDAYEVTEYLKKEFGKEKVLLVGHSWGTALGLLLVQKYPESFYAYVGSGQEINPSMGEKIGYEYIVRHAPEDEKARKEIADLNTPAAYLTIDDEEKWYKTIIAQRKWLVSLGGEIYQQTNHSLLFNFKTIFSPEYTLIDFAKFGIGSGFSLKAMWPEIMQLDLLNQVPSVDIPMFFFQGKHDYNTPASLVKSYYDTLDAPYKELVWFKESGHHPMYEEPKEFDAMLIEKVLPLCLQE